MSIHEWELQVLLARSNAKQEEICGLQHLEAVQAEWGSPGRRDQWNGGRYPQLNR